MSIDNRGESITSTVSYMTNGSVFIWGALTLNQVLAISAFLLALSTFAVNLYFQRRSDRRQQERDRRDKEFHDKRMQIKEQTERFVERPSDHDDPNPR